MNQPFGWIFGGFVLTGFAHQLLPAFESKLMLLGFLAIAWGVCTWRSS